MRNYWLVAKHEYRRMVFRRGFILATILIPVGMALLILFGYLVETANAEGWTQTGDINKNILVIDSLGVYKGLSFRPNYVLLRNSPRLNLNRVVDSINPELIIADASNYKSYVKRWKATCEDKKIPFHQTNEKGALIIK